MPRFLRFSAFLAAIMAIGPCTSARAGETASPPPSIDPPIEGVLTPEGQQCPTLRTKDGHLYTLMGDLHGFKPRDRVCIAPSYTDMTYCLQGTTAHVDRIGPAPCPPG
jgi:hypothetical protein